MTRKLPGDEPPDEIGEDPVEVPITNELDLHTFRPSEISELIPDYIEACLDAGIFQVRIIHGKGTGALRELVHKKLRENIHVAAFRLGDETTGGWGATLATLRRAPQP